jgi:sulfur-oxidizing protein SoxX
MNMKTISLAVAALGAGFLVAQSALAAGSSDADVVEVIKSSFRERGQARLDRLEQTDLQRECSKYQGRPVPKEVAERIEKKALADVKYPADGKFLGDWKKGEKIAQSGRGFQYNDKPGSEAGGNCYACHQLASHEVSFGNIGPSLHNYGKLRGYSPEVVRYTWARIWNPHSFKACNQMPRFGAAGILTEEQIRDVMALLLDPESPVNK